MKNRFAVIGNPINHSLSPFIHQQFAEQRGLLLQYERIQVSKEDFETCVTGFFDQGGKGLNITSPFKEQAFEMAAAHSLRCQQAKAANTLWLHQGLLQADTTDGVGLVRDLANYLPLRGKQVLLLGAGGAARSIIAPLLEANIAELRVANRSEWRAKALQTDFPTLQCSTLEALDSRYDLIINATSASLSNEPFSLPRSLVKASTCCYDLTYRIQALTPFVQWARQQGCQATDGLGMLVEQAAEAFYLWHGWRPETGSVLLKLRTQ